MISASVAAKLVALQSSFYLISVIDFTAHLWPLQANVQDGDSYDFIVVGAGTAGSVIASRLTENENIRVLLVEAGGDPPLESMLPKGGIFLKKSRYDWNYTSENEFSGICHQNPYFEMTQGKMLGGTNSMDFMVYSRGHPTDFDSWAEIVEDASWKWENVLPYFAKSVTLPDDFFESKTTCSVDGKEGDDRKGYMQRTYETKGPLKLSTEDKASVNKLLESFKELGHKILDKSLEGIGYARNLVTIHESTRQSSARAYLTPVKDRTNLHVLKEALVTKINMKDKKAVGVEIMTNHDAIINVNAKREVIISAGAFNSPKLLMLSGVGPKKHLEEKNIKVVADLPVGKDLTDHVGVVVRHSMERQEEISRYSNSYPVVTATGSVALNKLQNYPDYGTISYYTHEKIIIQFCVHVARLTYEICDNMYEDGRMGLFTIVTNFNVKSRGEVILRSTDPKDAPLIRTGYFTNEEDLDNLVKYVQNFIPVVNTTYFKSIGAELINAIPDKCTEFEMWSVEYWKCYSACFFTGLNHFSGTCGMGRVVDSRLKVYGIQNLRVVDASVMPTTVKSNMVGSVIMIAEKAADMISEDNNIL